MRTCVVCAALLAVVLPAIARAQTGATDVSSVVIHGDGIWDGFFIYSDDALTCYKFVLEEVGT